MQEPTDDDRRLAAELAAKAVDPFRSLVSADAAQAMVDALVDELLFTDAGRLKLRAAAPDPQVDRSGSLPTGAEGSADKPKAGSGS